MIDEQLHESVKSPTPYNQFWLQRIIYSVFPFKGHQYLLKSVMKLQLQIKKKIICKRNLSKQLLRLNYKFQLNFKE